MVIVYLTFPQLAVKTYFFDFFTILFYCVVPPLQYTIKPNICFFALSILLYSFLYSSDIRTFYEHAGEYSVVVLFIK